MYRFLSSRRGLLVVSVSPQVRAWQLLKCKPASRALTSVAGLCSSGALRSCGSLALQETVPPHGAWLNKNSLGALFPFRRHPHSSSSERAPSALKSREGTFSPGGFGLEAGRASSARGSLAGIISEVKLEGRKVWQRGHCRGWRRQFSLSKGGQCPHGGGPNREVPECPGANDWDA